MQGLHFIIREQDKERIEHFLPCSVPKKLFDKSV